MNEKTSITLGSTATVAVAARPRNDDQGADPLSSETEGCQQGNTPIRIVKTSIT